MSPRVHNWIFAMIVGVVLGVTAWSVAVRDPQLGSAPSIALPERVTERVEKEEARPRRGRRNGVRRRRRKGRNRTERMIVEGLLSDHSADYGERVEP